MRVTYQLIDAPYPYLCAIFRCPCGAARVQHADEASSPPPGWERAAAGEEEYRCPTCCARPSAAAPTA